MAGGTISQAYVTPILEMPFKTGEDLSASQWKAMYLSAEGTVKKMTASALTQKFIGFLADEPESAVGSHCRVMVMGIAKAVAGAAITAFDFVMNGDSEGRVITATDNNQVVGMSLEAASAINQYIAVLIIHCPIKGDNT